MSGGWRVCLARAGAALGLLCFAPLAADGAGRACGYAPAVMAAVALGYGAFALCVGACLWRGRPRDGAAKEAMWQVYLATLPDCPPGDYESIVKRVTELADADHERKR